MDPVSNRSISLNRTEAFDLLELEIAAEAKRKRERREAQRSYVNGIDPAEEYAVAL